MAEVGRRCSERLSACGSSETTTRSALDARQRTLDILLAGTALVLLLPVCALLALAISLESRGPVFYRSRRVGLGGREFWMLKFRKMRTGVTGAPLTAVDDERFTRIGNLLAKTKLDEIPQLLNVLAGNMSLVGPRPEDASFVAMRRNEYTAILRVKPGITGLSQIAFAREMEILDPENRVDDYLERVLPQKLLLDELYATRRSTLMYLRVFWWTFVAIGLGRDVAVSRATGSCNLRRPRPAPSEALQMEGVTS